MAERQLEYIDDQAREHTAESPASELSKPSAQLARADAAALAAHTIIEEATNARTTSAAVGSSAVVHQTAQGVEAARNGQIAQLTSWLDDHGDPNQYDADGWTPLLAAAVRGHAEAVELLHRRGADLDLVHGVSGARPITFAGHSASIPVAAYILDHTKDPGEINWQWPLNGHTLLLQCAFYATPAHEELAKFALAHGASVAYTTVRGLSALAMALQFNNQRMAAIIRQYDKSDPQPNLSPKQQVANAQVSLAAAPDDAARAPIQANLDQLVRDDVQYEALLATIQPTAVDPTTTDGKIQQLTDRMVETVQRGLADAAKVATPGSATSPGTPAQTLQQIEGIINARDPDDPNVKFEVNRLGGPLTQPPLVVAVTGGDGTPAVASLRVEIVKRLVDAGATPMTQEVHPMAVDAIIRALVFNHLDELKIMATHLRPAELAEALNRAPVANGLTGFHDTVLRAGRAPEAQLAQFIEQIQWCLANGARTDIEDFSGRTQADLARAIPDQPFPDRRATILTAMGLPVGGPSQGSVDRAAPSEVVMTRAVTTLYTALGGYHTDPSGSIATLHALLAPQAHWYVPGHNLIAGYYRGVEAIAGYLTTLERVTGDEATPSGLPSGGKFHPVLKTVSVSGNVATVQAAASAARTPGGTQFGGQRVALDGQTLGLYELIVELDGNGKITSLETRPDNMDLFNSYWSGGHPP